MNGSIDVRFYWKNTYLPPSGSTFSAPGSKKSINSKPASSLALLPDEKLTNKQSLIQKASKAGIKLPKNQVEYEEDKNDFKETMRSSRPSSASKTIGPNLSTNNNLIEAIQKSQDSTNKKESESEDEMIGNSTIRRRPENLPRGTLSPVEHSANDNPPQSFQHYNDTLFGDDQQRTYSPNELDSLRSNYQNNLMKNNLSDEETDGRIEEEIEEELDQNEDDEDEVTAQEGVYRDTLQTQNTMNFDSTGRSDGVVVGQRGSWDPNGTSDLPKHGDQNHVIIEVSNFTLNERTEVLKKPEVKRLFVGIGFLDYDPASMESKSLPKPKINDPLHFNFRKSN